MEKLYPIAKAETRHLFVHPSIRSPWDIVGATGYTGEETSYLKPGKVENLMKLCKPEGVTFTVFEEPNTDKMVLDGVLFSIKDVSGHWVTCRAVVKGLTLSKLNASQWGFEGNIDVLGEDVIDMDTGTHPHLGCVEGIWIPIKLRYDRATRCLEWSSHVTYDNAGIELLGITLDLDWVDSKKF